MNPFNIIRLLDYTFYHDIINSSSLKDNIVPKSSNVWNQVGSNKLQYMNTTSKNVDDRYYATANYDMYHNIQPKGVLYYTGAITSWYSSLRPSITFAE